jgi:FkbM family methyltransferase
MIIKVFIKKIYSLIPFKRNFYLLIKNFNPPASIYQHLYFNGEFKIKIDGNLFFKMIHYGYQLENELFWNGLYHGFEKYSITIWSELSKTQSVVFDVGANTGIYSLIAKANNRNSFVYAFEPIPAIHNLLVRNCAINSYNISTNCVALSNKTGDGFIHVDNEKFSYTATINRNIATHELYKINIKMLTLKDYINRNNIRSIDLMKIDVEGHEPEVIEGFFEYLLEYKPILLIEILSDDIADKLKFYFPTNDFYFYNVDERIGIKKVNSLTKSDFYNFYIVPKNKVHLMNEALSRLNQRISI